MTLSGSTFVVQGGHRPHGIHINTDTTPPATTPGASTPTAAYSSRELGPYSATSNVSSFNYPATTDSTLLTPVSSAGSPPTRHKASIKKAALYRRSQTAASQQPTPPTTATHWFPSFDVSQSSQTSSPIAVSGPSAEQPFDMTNSLHVPHSPGHREDTIPPQPNDPYVGHYGVSTPSPADDMPTFSGYPYLSATTDVDPGGFWTTPMQLDNRGYPPPPSSVIGNTLPLHMPRVGSVQDLAVPPRQQAPAESTTGHKGKGGRKPPRPRTRPSSKNPGSRRPSGQANPTPPPRSMDAAAGGDDDDDQLRLADHCPDEDRDIFRLRMEYNGEKGEMWKELRQKYAELHSDQRTAALQMKVSRAVARYGIWPKREEKLLYEAFMFDEENRYKRLKQYMKEHGGCRCWDWTPGHIETKLVEMGLEELKPRDNSHRKRKRNVPQQRVLDQAVLPPRPGDWTPNGQGVNPMVFRPLHFDQQQQQHHHHHHHQQQQHSADHRQGSSYRDTMPNEPGLTEEQRDELVDEVFRDLKVEPDSPMSGDGLSRFDEDDGGILSSPGSHADLVAVSGRHQFHNHQSERVARQACEQIMLEEGMHDSPYPSSTR